ncbi:hypothetical protein GCM10029992_53560 [Glycomyces albus]
MLPQPNFGPASEPDPVGGDDDEELGPPKQIGRLRIAMWVQAVCAVIAGNFLVVAVFSYRGMTLDELTDIYDGAEGVDDPAGLAQDAFDYYQGTGFLASTLTMAIVAVLAAIVTALCAMRLKTRLKSVRWTAVVTSVLLFLTGMLMTTVFGYWVAPWVVASVLSLWWLFAGDVRWWMSEKRR